MRKVDLRKDLRHLYGASAKNIAVVDVPSMNFLMVDGVGDPNTSSEYQKAVEALFSVSYSLKFAFKKSFGVDYRVMPLEGLWWADDMTAFLADDRANWKWTMMIMQPDFIRREDVDDAIATAARKRPNPMLAALRFESFAEGRAAQMLYVGPYAAEGPAIAQLHAFIEEQGGKLAGKHHEIYLSDPRRVPVEKLKTIIRQPFTL